MEFRCRLASASGEVVEGVYVAENEARLRHELEEKGLYVLSLQQKGALAGVSFRLPSRSSIPSREFLIFNQELATLLRAGMPLVQSLDLLKSRIQSPVFRSVLSDVHERVRSGSALSDAFAAHASLFPSVYTASLVAGERSGNLDAVLRRFVEYSKIIATIKRKTISALIYPLILISLATVLVSIIVLKVVPAFSDFYGSFNAQLPFITRVIVSDLRVRARVLLAALDCRGRGRRDALRLDETAGTASTPGSLAAQRPDARRRRTEVRDVANGSDVVDATQRRLAARERARHRRAIGGQPLHRSASSTSLARVCVKVRRLPAPSRRAMCFQTSP